MEKRTIVYFTADAGNVQSLDYPGPFFVIFSRAITYQELKRDLAGRFAVPKKYDLLVMTKAGWVVESEVEQPLPEIDGRVRVQLWPRGVCVECGACTASYVFCMRAC